MNPATISFAEREVLRAGAARGAGLRAAGTYVGRPTHASRAFHKAELAFIPMSEPHEYESVALFEAPQAAPVLISPTQRYAILTALVRELRAQLPGLALIGVRLYGPDFDVQLSAELLASDVLVTHAPLQLVPSMLSAGRRNIAIIQHDLRADGLEQGRNAFAVWLIAPTDDAVDPFLRFVETNPFLQSLAGLHLRTFDAAASQAGAAQEACA